MPPEVESEDPPETPETDDVGTQGDGEGGTGTAVDDAPDTSKSTTDADSPETDTRDEPPEGEGGDGDDETTPKKSGAFANLLAKYDGDEEKLAEGVWNQATSLSKMNKRLDELQETLQQTLTPPEPDIEAVVNDDPYVKEAANDLRSTDARVKDAQKEQVQIIAEHGKLEKSVARLEGALKAAPPEDRDEIREELREARGDRKEAARNYRESKRDIEALNKELRGCAQKFRDAEANAKDRLGRERQSAQSRKEQEAITRQGFTDAVASEAKKYGIPTDSQTYSVLHQSIRDRISGFLRALPKGSPGIDIDEAVGVLMEEYVEAMDLKSRFQRSSTNKRKASGRQRAEGLTVPDDPGDKKGVEWTPDFVRKRAKQLLGG